MGSFVIVLSDAWDWSVSVATTHLRSPLYLTCERLSHHNCFARNLLVRIPLLHVRASPCMSVASNRASTVTFGISS
jgi:hypothetical protein